MPDKQTIERAKEDARKGKSPSIQAGELVREEMHHIREIVHQLLCIRMMLTAHRNDVQPLFSAASHRA